MPAKPIHWKVQKYNQLISGIWDAEDIPIEEIANAVKEILSHQVSLPQNELGREVSRLFSFAHSGTNIESAVRKGINEAIINGYVCEKEGRVVFKES